MLELSNYVLFSRLPGYLYEFEYRFIPTWQDKMQHMKFKFLFNQTYEMFNNVCVDTD